MEVETIVAPATPPGESALAVIRVSGPRGDELMAAAYPERRALPHPRRATRGTFRDVVGQIIDEQIFIRYEAGASFTGESMWEIICHGNPYIVRRILEDLVARGCRLAEPGEFTRRAFLNGKLDLTQAEAVAEVIRARNEKALELANRQLRGAVTAVVGELREDLLEATARLEAYIDFPEEDLPPEDSAAVVHLLRRIEQRIQNLVATRPAADLAREGIRCVLAGPPNAGKSSLLNALLGEDRALVSPEPGTTRDYLEGATTMGGYLVRLVDTAGMREAATELEAAGVARSREQVARADVVLLVVDGSLPRPTLPDAWTRRGAEVPLVVVENKVDLGRVADEGFFAEAPRVAVSAVTGEGLAALRKAVVEAVEGRLPGLDADAVLVAARHAEALERAGGPVREARCRLESAGPAELVASDLREATVALEAILGRIDHEEVLDAVFGAFCIGK